MQIFPRTVNLLPLVVGLGLAGGGAGVTAVIWYYFSAYNTQVGYQPEQPIHYSHELHAGKLGMDCRYCHANVERSARAMVPPTQTCMGCHAQIKKDSPLLEPLRQSWANNTSIEWVRVHKLPDHAFFDHSVHLSAGVGCRSCHGRIDQMEVVRQSEPLSMSWCLDCHRAPENHLRPLARITDMECALGGEECTEGSACCSGGCDEGSGTCAPLHQACGSPGARCTAAAECCAGSCAEGRCAETQVAMAAREVSPPTHCSGCHR